MNKTKSMIPKIDPWGGVRTLRRRTLRRRTLRWRTLRLNFTYLRLCGPLVSIDDMIYNYTKSCNKHNQLILWSLPVTRARPAGIWRFCPGRDFVFSRDFSRDFSKIKSVFERKFEPKFHEPVKIFRKVLLQQCSTVLLNS